MAEGVAVATNDRRLTWDDYFEREKKTVFQKLVNLYRKMFIAGSVRYYVERYFPGEGIFIEAGAGTSQSSSEVEKKQRKLIAVDSNQLVLARHNILDYKIQGDILSMPVKTNIADGLWNIGVMEHFTDDDVVRVLREYQRVIKDNGIIIIYWPPYFAPYNIALTLAAWTAKIVLRRRIEFFPNEINPYRNKRRLIRFLEQAGLRLVKLDYNIMDMFTYMVIIAKKGVTTHVKTYGTG